MSSCFLCDTSYKFKEGERYNVVYAEGQQDAFFMKYMPIMVGSSGTNTNDQQHTNEKTQNYVSYRVKKIEFCFSAERQGNAYGDAHLPDYVIIFKVPFREIIFDYYFTLMSNFILYSEPESILTYGVYKCEYSVNPLNRKHAHVLNVNKPFIVGPNDYVGVLYFFKRAVYVEASAKVWFDVV